LLFLGDIGDVFHYFNISLPLIGNVLSDDPIGQCSPHVSLRLMHRSDPKRMKYFPTFINYMQIILEMTGVALCPLVVQRPIDPTSAGE
jgi:hypothetical protein